MTTAHRIRTALIRRSHGVRGAVRVEPLGGTADRFAVGMVVRVDTDGPELTITEARPLPDGDVLMQFEGVADRNAADLLRGRYLTVDQSAARPLGKDEWFVDAVIGLRAVTPEGVEIGTVTDIESYAANDVVVVKSASGERRFPMVKAFVQRVQPDAGTITITPWDEED